MNRPTRRGECLPSGWNGERPCPWVGCRYHLGIYVAPTTGFLRARPGVEEGDLAGLGDTCALDVADRGGHTLEETGEVLGVTRERIRQLERLGVAQFLRNASDLATVELEEGLRAREAAWAPDDLEESEPEEYGLGPGSLTAARARTKQADLSPEEIAAVRTELEPDHWRSTAEIHQSVPEGATRSRVRAALVSLRTGGVAESRRRNGDGGRGGHWVEWRIACTR